MTEKGTDVNIAVWMLSDYMRRKTIPALPEASFLITGDSDQAPTIRRLRDVDSTYPVYVAFPPMRVSGELERYAGRANCTMIDADLLEGCCLPEQLSADLYKPASWA
jgi:hypothetical protein